MAEAGKQESAFELVGGRLCLDFVNTLNGSRETGETEEKLLGYADLVSWGRQAGILAEREARALLKEAARAPAKGTKAVARSVALREAIYGIFSAIAQERPPSKEDLSTLNNSLSEALARSEIVSTPEGFRWDWRAEGRDLTRVLWPVARSAAELLTSDEVARARVCEADDCTWVFMDVSKNRSRRWCDMKYCGNRAKSRRHYERKRATMKN